MITRTLGELHLAEGDLVAARAELESGLARWTELGLSLWRARTLRDLAAALEPTEPLVAARHWKAAMEVFRLVRAREAVELRGTGPGDWLARIDGQVAVAS